MGIFVSAGLLVFSLNIVVDPFGRNQIFQFGLPKSTVSYKMNYPLYKIQQYSIRPRPIIVLGDSRSDQLQAAWFEEFGVPEVFNFSYPSGTLIEAIETFWFAASKTQLKRVFFGIPFNLYSETNHKNRFIAAKAVADSPISYYFSSLVTRASVNNVLSHILKADMKTDRPQMDKDKFWQVQLGTNTSMYYGRWRKPHVLLKELTRMAEFCARKGIDLIFYIPPTHVDLQRKVIEHGLADEYLRYKRDLSRLGKVVDFEFENSVTLDRANFGDPYHAKYPVLRDVVHALIDAQPGQAGQAPFRLYSQRVN